MADARIRIGRVVTQLSAQPGNASGLSYDVEYIEGDVPRTVRGIAPPEWARPPDGIDVVPIPLNSFVLIVSQSVAGRDQSWIFVPGAERYDYAECGA